MQLRGAAAIEALLPMAPCIDVAGRTAQDLATADAVLRMARASGQYPELPW